ncbi:MAG: hypothetical protein ACPGSI_11470 [Pikeienuella sp.]
MQAFLIEAVVLSLRDPRRGVRLVLDNVQGTQGALVMFGLALIISCLVAALHWILVGPPDLSHLPAETPVPTLSQAVQGMLIVSAMFLAVFMGIVFGVGKLFGGTANIAAVVVALAWHSILTAPLAPFVTVSSIMGPDGPAFWRIGLLLFTTWLLICFVAEVHRFRSAWLVGAVVAGFMFGLSLIFVASLSGA